MQLRTSPAPEHPIREDLEYFVQRLSLSANGGQLVGIYGPDGLVSAETGALVIAVPRHEIRVRSDNAHHPTGQFSLFFPVQMHDDESGEPVGDVKWCRLPLGELPSCTIDPGTELPPLHRYMKAVFPSSELYEPGVIAQEYEWVSYTDPQLDAFLERMIERS